MVIGSAVADDDPPAEQDLAVPVVAADSGSGLIPDSPGPVSEVEAEPVAAVARAVLPSVVQIVVENVGQGSGIVYDASGLIVTNAHVVGGETSASVQLADGRTVDGEVLGTDEVRDIAVIRVDAGEPLVAATLAPLSSVEVGQVAVAVGSPFGLDQTVTAGIVSAVGRVVPSFGRGRVAMIQTDAPINPGNSGGALADIEGRVVGLNTSIRTDGTSGNQGVGFAIPADTFKLVADRIVAGEPIATGFLGVEGVTPTDGTHGARLTRVVENSPASAAGLQDGDLVVAIDGVALSGIEQLAAKVQLTQPGTSIAVDVVRDGETRTFTVILGSVD